MIVGRMLDVNLGNTSNWNFQCKESCEYCAANSGKCCCTNPPHSALYYPYEKLHLVRADAEYFHDHSSCVFVQSEDKPCGRRRHS